jgi:hypothetical protein
VRALLLAAAIIITMTPAARAAQLPARSVQEAAFLKTVNPLHTANVVTGDLVAFTGKHVAYVCEVDQIVRAGVILGQCGSDAEPMDLFVELPTAGLRMGQRLRVLGILEHPASWTDLWGHTVYYAFLKAVFVDPVR